MTHAQKPEFVFRRNGRVHLNRRGRQFSRLLAAEVCASAVVMLDTPCSEVVWRVLATRSIRLFPLHSSPPVRLRVPSHFNWTGVAFLTFYSWTELLRQKEISVFARYTIPDCEWGYWLYWRGLYQSNALRITIFVFSRLLHLHLQCQRRLSFPCGTYIRLKNMLNISSCYRYRKQGSTVLLRHFTWRVAR